MYNQGSVFIKAIITDVDGSKHDISNMIANFEHFISIPETDLTTITLDTYKWWEEEEEYAFLRRGNVITYQYGYTAGDTSPEYVGRIVWVNTSYSSSDGCKEVLRISPTGISTKFGGSNKVWKDKTASQIAREIAARHRLYADVDDTNRVYKNLPQGNRSDIEFLRYLARREHPNMNVYLTSSGIMFKRIGTYKKSKYLFDLSDPNHSVISLTFDWQEVTQDKNWIASYTKDGAVDTEKLVSDVEALAPKVVQFDKEGNALQVIAPEIVTEGTVEQQIVGTVGNAIASTKPIIENFKNVWEGSSLAKNLKTEQKIQELTANLTVVGYPSYMKDDLLTIKGVKSRLEGNYWIQSVTHTINVQSGFTTEFDLNRNGLKFDKKDKSIFEQITEAFFPKKNTVELEDNDSRVSFDRRGNATTVVAPYAPDFNPDFEGNLID